jgi:YcxB-like protein
MVTFSGKIDRPALQRALRIQSKGLIRIGVIIGIAGALGLFFTNMHEPESWGAPLFLLLFGVFMLFSPWLGARQQMKTSSMLTAPITGTADEERVTFESEFGHSAMPWARLHRAVVRPDMVLLYAAANQFFIVAESYFVSRAEWEEFTQLVSKHVAKLTR